MSNTRRYTSEQVKRVKESGEKANVNDYGIPASERTFGEFDLAAETAFRNMMAGVVRAPTDLLTVAGVAAPAVEAGLSSDVDLADAMYGEEGLGEIQSYVKTKADRVFSKLPPEKQTAANREKVQDAVLASHKTMDIMNSKAPTLYKTGVEAGNAVNEFFGLNRTEEETTADEVAQIIGSALIPLPAGIAAKATSKLATGAIKTGLKGALNVAEVALPGTAGMTAGRLGANIAVGGAMSQGIRYATDQPSVVTGDAFAAQQLTETKEDPIDDDELGGVSGEQIAAASATVGSIAMGLSLAIGKSKKLAAKLVSDSADEGLEEAAKAKVANDAAGEEFSPQLSGPERAKSDAVDKASPLADITKKAFKGSNPELAADAVDDVRRAAHDATSASISTRMESYVNNGILDGLDYQALAPSKFAQAVRDLGDEGVAEFDQYMLAKTLHDRRQLDKQSLADELVALKVQRTAASRDPDAYRALSSKIGSAQAKLRDMDADVETARGDVPSMSTADARKFIEAAESNLAVKNAEMMFRRIIDDITQSKINSGKLSLEDASKLRQSHPGYMLLKQDPYAGMSGSAKFWEQTKGKFSQENGKGRRGVRSALFTRNAETIEGEGRVTKPMSTLESLGQYALDHISFTQRDNAIKAFVQSVKGTPMEGKAVRMLHKPMSMDTAIKTGMAEKYSGRANVVSYMDKGLLHIAEVSDPEVARALHFNAPAVNVMLNASRLMWQKGTTGTFAPWFAVKGALFETGAAQIIRKPGRSLGMIDMTLRKALPNSSAINYLMDRAVDPTFYIQQLAGVFNQVSSSNMKAIGEKIGKDLERQSGLFAGIAQLPGMEKVLSQVGTTMVKAYNESTFAVFANNHISNSNIMDDPMTVLRNDFSSILDNLPVGSDAAITARNTLAQAYNGTLEAIHNSAKYAFFAQNYSLLQKKHGGKIPQKQLDKLVYETKTLSGDMTAVAGSDFFTKLYSSMPYSQITVSSTRNTASFMKNNWEYAFPRFMMGIGAPMALGVYMMSQDEKTSDWYWNKLPAWQRMSSIPVVNPEWWAKYLAGEAEAVQSTDISLMPIAPEYISVTATAMAGMRALGWFGGDAQQYSSFKGDLAHALETLSGLAAPPALNAIAAVSGYKFDPASMIGNLMGVGESQQLMQENRAQGANLAGMTYDSEISKNVHDSVVALFGNAWGLAFATYEVGADTLDNEESGFLEAAKKAFDYTIYEGERRLPEIPGTDAIGLNIWTNGQRRSYVTTQERDYVNKAMRGYEAIAAQKSVDKNADAKSLAAKYDIEPPPEMKDPKALALIDSIHPVMKTGRMKKIGDEVSDINKSINWLEANKDRKDPKEYHALKNHFTIQVQKLDAERAELIKALDSNLRTSQGMGLEDAYRYIVQSVK